MEIEGEGDWWDGEGDGEGDGWEDGEGGCLGDEIGFDDVLIVGVGGEFVYLFL